MGDFKKSWAAALKAAGIVDLHYHDLRHTFASRLAQRGVPLLQVGKLLGHSSLRMTQRYAHPALENLRDAIAALARARDAASGFLATSGRPSPLRQDRRGQCEVGPRRPIGQGPPGVQAARSPPASSSEGRPVRSGGCAGQPRSLEEEAAGPTAAGRCAAARRPLSA
ncbi:site-specific integrase [Sediminicoccus sp. BL-A-41-H5]|uniref:site-specific integrase n=1 Tax=Sediminicoccus sp. BL-A-41-H5 TaxID=3421106 RepID=UPI003D678865